MVQAISNWATKFGALCACFLNMAAPEKTQVENGLNKLLYLWGQTIAVAEQAVLILEDLSIHDE